MSYTISQTRFDLKPKSTAGNLILPFVPFAGEFCKTLEDTVRPKGEKIDRHTAIPETDGVPYKVGIRTWLKHNKECLVLYDRIEVMPDGFELFVIERHGKKWTQVMAHGGVTVDHTDACVLCGYEHSIVKGEYNLHNRASDDLFAIVAPYIRSGETVLWEIVNEPKMI